MAYFRVPLEVRPVGGGRAELSPPPALEGTGYRFVAVKDGGEEAVIEVDAQQRVLGRVAADGSCTRLSGDEAEALRASYPAPRLKQRRVEAMRFEVPSGPEPVPGPAAEDRFETVQTVRCGFYLIDVPVAVEGGQR